MEQITVAKIHKEFVPKYDRAHGKLVPKLKSWVEHIGEIIYLVRQGDKPYWKHNRTTGTCREHTRTEFGDWLWLSAEIFWMITHIQLPIVSQKIYRRIWDKMEQTRNEEKLKNASCPHDQLSLAR